MKTEPGLSQEKVLEIRLAVARLIWRSDHTINDLYAALGVDASRYDDDVGEVVSQLAAILTAWQNPPEEEPNS